MLKTVEENNKRGKKIHDEVVQKFSFLGVIIGRPNQAINVWDRERDDVAEYVHPDIRDEVLVDIEELHSRFQNMWQS